MERKNYRIIALDMDGTLLTSNKTIAPDTVRDIRAASERGIHVVYCTGRAIQPDKGGRKGEAVF